VKGLSLACTRSLITPSIAAAEAYRPCNSSPTLVRSEEAALLVFAFVRGTLSFALGSTLFTRVLYEAAQAPTMAGSYATAALNIGAAVGPLIAATTLSTAAGNLGLLWASGLLVLVALLVVFPLRAVLAADRNAEVFRCTRERLPECRGAPTARRMLPHSPDRTRRHRGPASQRLPVQVKEPVRRTRRDGFAGPPERSIDQTPSAIVDRVEHLRRENKWSARRIALDPASEGVRISERTLGRWLTRLGVNHRGFLDPDGSINRRPPGRIVARYPGQMVHLDVKKVERIPDGGGWRADGPNSQQAKLPSARNCGRQGGYTCLHSAIDGCWRLAYTEHLPDEKATTTVVIMSRARAFFAAHGIRKVTRVVTDNGPNYRAVVFVRSVTSRASRHQRTKPYMPRHNGKVERYQCIVAEQLLCTRRWASEEE
jgi:hypothetical protein